MVPLPGGDTMKADSTWVTDALGSSGTWIPAPKIKGPPITVLVDGDLIAYRSAAATQGTFYRIEKESTKYYKDALRIALRYAKGDEVKAKALIRKDKNPEPLSHAIHNMQKMIEGARKSVALRYGRPVEFEVFLTADVLFRDDITPLYKKSREGLERPVHLQD